MQQLDLPVTGGTMCALRFGTGPKLVLAAHGISASAMAFATVARHLPADWSLIALDLRGRGRSAGLTGPYGMDAHAADLCMVAERLGAPVVLTGHSMGAYAVLRAAATRPELFAKVVLIDGGPPLPIPPSLEPDAVIEATVGPALTRLAQVFADEDAYVEFFRAHPAFTGDWNDDAEAYARYDTKPVVGGVGPRADRDAVYADGRDLVINAESFGADLARLTIPALLLYAPRNLVDQEPGMLPESVVAHWTAATSLRAERVDDVNHYTIMFAERPAKLITDALTR